MTKNRLVLKGKKHSAKKIRKESTTQEEKVKKILAEMQQKLSEIEKLRKELQEAKMAKITPQQTKALLEEIKVPPLELIIDHDKKKSTQQHSAAA